MINMSINHIPPAQIYAFEVGYQARALKFIDEIVVSMMLMVVTRSQLGAQLVISSF